MTRSRGLFVLVLLWLGIGWGATHPLGKMATAGGQGPLGLLFWQLVVCVAVLGLIALVRRKGLRLTREALAFYLIIAILGTVIPNTTFYISVARLPAGIMSIVTSTVPMIAFPIALALGMERFSGRRFLGLLLGLAGVLLIAAPGSGGVDPAILAFLPVALIAPAFYAVEATFVARTGMRGMDALQAMFGAALAGLVLVTPLTLASGQFYSPLPLGRDDAALVLSATLHALLYATYVWLAASAGSVFASQSSYLVTAAGMIWAMTLLGERFSSLVWLAVALMLIGVALVRPQPKDKAAAAAKAGEACSA